MQSFGRGGDTRNACIPDGLKGRTVGGNEEARYAGAFRAVC